MFGWVPSSQLCAARSTIRLSGLGLARTIHSSPVRAARMSEVWSWGYGHLGGCGHGDYSAQPQPKAIDALSDRRIVSLGVGWSRSYAVSSDGEVWWWGWSKTFKHLLNAQRVFQRWPNVLESLQRYGTSLPGFNVLTFQNAVTTPELMGADMFDNARISEIRVGGDHTVALDREGRVWTWGVGYYGQLGHGDHSTETHIIKPQIVRALTPSKQPPPPPPPPQPQQQQTKSDADGAAAPPPPPPAAELREWWYTTGSGHGKRPLVPCILRPTPPVSSAGVTATAATQKRPKPIKIVSIAAGFQHTLCLADSGMVYVMGKGSGCALGIWRLTDSAETLAIERKSAHNVHMRLDTPACIQHTNHADSELHKREEMGSDITAVSAGFSFSVFLDRSGQVWTCGKNSGGELGVGDFQPQSVPKRVTGGGLGLQRVVAIASGQHHTLALTNTGQVWSWGISKQGQCGRPDTDAVISEKAVKAAGVKQAVRTMPLPAVIDLSHLPVESRRIISIYAGFYDSVLVNDRGQTIMFGGNNSQTGYNPLPRLVDAEALTESGGAIGLAGARINTIAFGLNHTIAVVTPRN